MLKCTYIIILNNNEDNIPYLIKSLKEITGAFRKEFIIIDDGSKDKSLNMVKAAVNDLPRTTIITQENQGAANSINEALNLATGDYIHFVEGDEILYPGSTMTMITACNKFGVEVACSKLKEIENINDLSIILPNSIMEEKLIPFPLKEILLNKIPFLRNIGSSGSLAQRALVEKAGKADSSIYSQTMSLSLRCAKYSNFVFIDYPLSFKRKIAIPKDKKFESYNNIRALHNFASSHPDIFQSLISELVNNLIYETPSKKLKIKYYFLSILARHFKFLSLDKVLEFYRNEYEKLF